MFEKLSYLVALARERHFGRAARVCGVSQPSLSIAIRSLEDLLGVSLINRSGAGFRGLTTEGERVLMWAHRIVNGVEAMKRDVLDIGGAGDTSLRIGAIPSAIPLLAKMTGPLLTRHPGTRLTVLQRSSKALLNMLDAREIDIGLTYLTEEATRYTVAVSSRPQQFAFVTSPEGRLGHAATVTWQQVADAPLCLLDHQSEDRQLIDSIFRKIGIQTRPRLESDCVQTLLSWVRLGHSSSIIPLASLDGCDEDDFIKVVPIVDMEDAARPICIVARPNAVECTTTAAFLSELAKNLPSAANGEIRLFNRQQQQ